VLECLKQNVQKPIATSTY